MVTRYVLLKLNESALPQRPALAQACLQGLRQVPGVLDVRIELPADPDSARSWDLCVKVSFDNIEAVAAYVPHPIHQAFVAEVLAPVVAFKKTWNFQEQGLGHTAGHPAACMTEALC